MKSIAFVLASTVALSGCMNMPTPVNQITPAYVSTLNYDGFDCNKLTVEMDALSHRESMLVAAQTQRIKTSETQAFWYGYGQGDGVEATELARVRGEREAVIKALATKSCAAS